MFGSSIGHQFGLAGAALAALVAAAGTIRPVFVGRAPVVQRLVGAAWADSAGAGTTGGTTDGGAVRSRAPWAFLANADSALRSDQFEQDRRAFVEDLVATGRLDEPRAEALATYAVREAYLRRVPPALVFGVLLTENETFKSRARSSVGAVGLMQIVPRVWVPELGRLFGRNLHDDETNLRYGVHILAGYLYRSAARVATAEGAVSTGLLRYNGCVRGTNTPSCHRYPDRVRAAVEQYAVAQCGDGGYARCVEEPMRASLAAVDVETRLADAR